MAYLESRKNDAGITSGLRKYRTSSSRAAKTGSRDRNQLENSECSVLPHALKSRLQTLFSEIEGEFSVLYQENLQLKERILALEKGQYETDEKDKTLIDEHDAFDKNVLSVISVVVSLCSPRVLSVGLCSDNVRFRFSAYTKHSERN